METAAGSLASANQRTLAVQPRGCDIDFPGTGREAHPPPWSPAYHWATGGCRPPWAAAAGRCVWTARPVAALASALTSRPALPRPTPTGRPCCGSSPIRGALLKIDGTTGEPYGNRALNRGAPLIQPGRPAEERRSTGAPYYLVRGPVAAPLLAGEPSGHGGAEAPGVTALASGSPVSGPRRTGRWRTGPEGSGGAGRRLSVGLGRPAPTPPASRTRLTDHAPAAVHNRSARSGSPVTRTRSRAARTRSAIRTPARPAPPGGIACRPRHRSRTAGSPAVHTRATRHPANSRIVHTPPADNWSTRNPSTRKATHIPPTHRAHNPLAPRARHGRRVHNRPVHSRTGRSRVSRPTVRSLAGRTRGRRRPARTGAAGSAPPRAPAGSPRHHRRPAGSRGRRPRPAAHRSRSSAAAPARPARDPPAAGWSAH